MTPTEMRAEAAMLESANDGIATVASSMLIDAARQIEELQAWVDRLRFGVPDVTSEHKNYGTGDDK